MSKLLVFMFSTAFIASIGHAGDELNSEINDLQVRIVRLQPKGKPQQKVAQAAPIANKTYEYQAAPAKQSDSRPLITSQSTAYVAKPVPAPTRVASAPAPAPRIQQQQPVQAYNPPEDNTYSEPPALTHPAYKNRNSNNQLIRRAELVESYNMSSFSGGDSSTVIPNGISNPFTNSFLNVNLRADIDIGLNLFSLEVGGLVTQTGATTGNNPGYTFSGYSAYSEKVTLTYLEAPINLKWRSNIQNASAFYARAGAVPAFMVQHSYISSTNISNEYRFGGYSTFDIQVDAGVGFDLKLSDKLHGLVEGTFYQGFMPVLNNYNVYNYGFLVGLGVGYVL